MKDSKIELKNLLSKDRDFYLDRFPTLNLEKTKKVVLFGAGQMGTIYLNFFKKLGIDIVAFFDNDRKKIGGSIGKIPILGIKSWSSFSRHTNIIITSIYDEEIFEQLKRKGFDRVWSHAFLATFYNDFFPNPYWSNSIDTLLRNKNKLLTALDLFSEEKSREVFLNIINYRLFLDRKYISKTRSPLKSEYFDSKIIALTEKEVFIDGGAYDGDTIKRFINVSGHKYKKIIGFEPDLFSYVKLEKLIKRLDDRKIKIYKYGLAEKNKTIRFTNDGTLGSRVNKSSRQEIKVISLDKLLSKEEVTFIKLDIEGSEKEALIGAKKTINKNKPKLAICVYHKPEDIWMLPLFMKELNPNYRFYLRHHSDFLYDTVCYAV